MPLRPQGKTSCSISIPPLRNFLRAVCTKLLSNVRNQQDVLSLARRISFTNNKALLPSRSRDRKAWLLLLAPIGVGRVKGHVMTAQMPKRMEEHMLYWALLFFIVAIVAAIFGFGGIAVAAAGIAKILFVVFVVLFLITLVAHLGRRGTSI